MVMIEALRGDRDYGARHCGAPLGLKSFGAYNVPMSWVDICAHRDLLSADRPVLLQEKANCYTLFHP